MKVGDLVSYSGTVGDLVIGTMCSSGIGVIKATTTVHNEALVHFQNGKCCWVAVFALEKLCK